jgi:hypothetical protein
MKAKRQVSTQKGMPKKGFTENEYIESEGSGTKMRNSEGQLIYIGDIK